MSNMKIKKLSVLFATIGASLISYQGFTNSSGAPSGRTGSPQSSSTCATAGCHTSGTITNQTISISTTIPASGYQANTNYTVTVTANDGSMGTGTIGFQASVEDATGHLGTVSSPGSGTQISGSYATHSFSGITSAMGVKSWSFTWNPGANPAANAMIYTAVNFANGNGGTSGDDIATQTLALSQFMPVAVAPCAKPFFSEYIEGSSNNKGFEIYNPTGAPLDLGPYKVIVSGNGGSFTNEFNLSGMLASGDVYTVTTDQSDPIMLAAADTSLSFPSVAHFNGDDAVFLVDTTMNDTLDVIGVIGVDPGSSWPVGTGSTQNHTLVRDTTINMGQTDWTIGATEWSVQANNTFNYLGAHASMCIALPCSTPFFSEYIEGSSNNKGFEIYNPSNSVLDLGPYKVIVSGNGGSFTNEFNLSGMLASGDVYTITTDQSDPIMLAAADTSLSFPSVAHFNGDDAVFLVDTTMNDTLDIIGVIGIDPGSSWPVGTGSTQNHTLVRNASISAGQTDWAIGATEWTVNPSNTYTFIGAHTSTCVNTTPMVSTANFVTATGTLVSEAAGNFTVEVNINPVSATIDTLSVMLTPGLGLTTADGIVMPLPNALGIIDLIIPAGADSTGFVFTIIDDAILEGNETLYVHMVNASANLMMGNSDSINLIIEDNDQVIPFYTISDVISVDTSFVADSLGVECKIVGTVFTDDFDGNAGYSFYMYDNTGGINVFNFVDEPGGYQVNRGDSIRVVGVIDFYNGLIELKIDSIAVLASNVSLVQPTQVFDLNESTEGEYIRLNGFYLVNPAGWPAFPGSSVNLDITNGVDTLVMRIDSDTDVDGSTAPTGYFDIIGAGGQFDSSAPYDEGYQIFPRDTMDIIPVIMPSLYISEVMPSAGSTIPAAINGDWFEVRNNGSSSVDLNGFSWDDASATAGTHSIATSVSIPAGEAAIFLDATTADVNDWIAQWGQSANNINVLNLDNQFNGFSGLSSNGDAVFLYDADSRLISTVAYDGAAVNSGVSLEFDMNGMYTGNATSGSNGAYTSVDGDVGSPGDMNPDFSLIDLLSNSLAIYPNPASTYFTISTPTNAVKTVEVRNVNGQLVSTVSSTDLEITISTESMAAGVYMLNINTADSRVTRKLVIH
jgi:hypothetical protein